MSDLFLQSQTDGIKNGSLSKSFHSNDTFDDNCTSIECFGEYFILFIYMINRKELSMLIL
jgi:hypothetical protein